MRGHLTGSIDAVLRHPETDDYIVVDYKTNKLTTFGAKATSDDYHPARLPDAMAHHHYPLQGLLYSVALHRYLRWRLADYDPARHLGGMAYLFVRGMTGPTTRVAVDAPFAGQRHGVYSWRPPTALIVELSDLLDGVRA
ncbi:MAG: PD-(D/E)XK nuclease family protein [Acidimicrobiales bacterium]